MTRLPTESWDLTGLKGPEYPPYKVGPLCCAPGCSRIADHAHHIVRRSALGGPFDWVMMPDGVITQNLCGLCYKCHSLVTENRADIRYRGERFLWYTGHETSFALDPQPRIFGANSDEGEVMGGHYGHAGPASGDSCPTCKRRIPIKTDGPREPKRNRASWAVLVPKDERENGADVLDALLVSCAQLLGHDEEAKKLRYHTLVQSLYLVVQNGERFVGDD